MGIEVCIGFDDRPKEYQPVLIAAIGMPFPIHFESYSHEIERVTSGDLERSALRKSLDCEVPRALGLVFRSSGREALSFSYNVWTSPLTSRSWGWSNISSLEEDVKVFKSLPSCVLIIETLFFTRLQRMATACGSTVRFIQFDNKLLKGNAA